MDKSQVIGGIVCLIIAAFLTVAYFALPPEELGFLVGENNLPLAPIVLGIIGLLLLITARKRAR